MNECKSWTEGFSDACRRISITAAEAAQAFRRAFNCYNLTEDLINQCPNKRLVYLALHHPKERVRKKNIHRIFKKEL